MNETRTAQNSSYYSDSISLWQLLKIMKRHFLLILVMTVLVGAGAFGIAKFALVPQYTSSAQILVNQKHATAHGQAFDNQQADIQMINTYKEIITNYKTLNKAQKQLANPTSGGQGYQLSYQTLKKMVKVRTIQNSQVFELKVTAPDAQEAATIANTVTAVFQKQIKHIMGFNNVKVTSQAVVAPNPSFPNPILFTILGALVGAFLGTVVAVVKEVN